MLEFSFSDVTLQVTPVPASWD